jgi:hypothetical protein
MKSPISTNLNDYVSQSEAEQITRLKRMQLYRYRTAGKLYWIKGETQNILYYKPDLLKLIGLNQLHKN